MVRTARERALYASRKASESAQRKRWQKVIREMRASGLAVDVWRNAEGGGSELHPDYRASAGMVAATR